MTVGSGKKLLRLLNRSGPVGRFLRTLLESRTWGSTECLLEWKARDSRSKCWIYQLAPSTPRTSEGDSGLWPTSSATEAGGGGSAERVRKEAEGIDHHMVCQRDMLRAMYQTPAVQQFSKRRQVGQEKREELMLPGQVKAMYRTPQEHNADQGPKSPEHFEKCLRTNESQITLTDQARASGPITTGPLSRTEKFVERLATLSAWLMGYTARYLAHWETASSGRSRRRSSGR